jgi:hypothetical protein
MALTVAHTTVVSVPDDGSSPVGSAEWNAAHNVTGTVDLTTQFPSGPAGTFLTSDGSTAQWNPSPSIRQHAAYTLANSAAVQKLFNGSANGAVTLPVGSYWFECEASLSAMSATSGNAAFSIANGTGTAANFLFNWSAIDDAAGAAGAWQSGMAVTSATPAAMATATVNTTLQFIVRGTFEVSVAGTFIPSIQLANAAAAVVAIGSFFRCYRLGAATDTAIGNWS